MIVSDGLLPCALVGSGHQCDAVPIGVFCACSQCGLTSAPIRGIHEAKKAMELPEKLRQLLYELLTTSDDQPPFSLLTVGSSHFDILPGLGRTKKDHPGEISLTQLFGEKAGITIKWGVLCPYAREAHVVEAAPADEEVADLPLFKRLTASFEKVGLEFRAPQLPGHHVFVGRFTLPETGDAEVGISVLLALRRDELMHKWMLAERAKRAAAK